MIARGPGERTGHPDLSALVRGEVDNDQILAAADHLDRCVECRVDLTHVVIGHALLTRTSEVMHDDRATEFTRASVLRPIDGDASGEIYLAEPVGSGARVRVTLRNSPALSQGQYLYVWLLDPRTDKMLPLGQVKANGTATFDVADEHLLAYSAIDISVESDDGNPEHSPRSVLRADYT